MNIIFLYTIIIIILLLFFSSLLIGPNNASSLALFSTGVGGGRGMSSPFILGGRDGGVGDRGVTNIPHLRLFSILLFNCFFFDKFFDAALATSSFFLLTPDSACVVPSLPWRDLAHGGKERWIISLFFFYKMRVVTKKFLFFLDIVHIYS